MLKKSPLLLSTNDNKLTLSDLTEINQKIILSEDFDKKFILSNFKINSQQYIIYD